MWIDEKEKKRREKKTKKKERNQLFYFLPSFFFFLSLIFGKTMSADLHILKSKASATPDPHAGARDFALEWTKEKRGVETEEGDDDDYPLGYYWSEIELSDSMPMNDQTRPVVLKVLTLHALFYLLSHFDGGVLDHLVDFCLGALKNYDVDLWETIFRCGFPEAAFKSDQQLATRLHTGSDMFGVSMFPGGSHLLSKRGEYEFKTIEGAVLPSMTNKQYCSSPYSVRPMPDGCGNVIFPLCALNEKKTTAEFLRNYFEGLLKHLWSDQFENMGPDLAFKHSKVTSQTEVQWVDAFLAYRRIRIESLKAKARERQATNAKNLASISSSDQIGDIEEFPPCIEATMKNIIARAPSHPKDPERYLIYGSLAFRMDPHALLQLSRKMDTDGTKEGEKHLAARTKKNTPSCSSTISNGLCPFNTDAERSSVCYSKMNGNGTKTFHSPAHLLIGK